jgi:hypothetical protein
VALDWEEGIAALAKLIWQVRQGKKPDYQRPKIRVNFREPEPPMPTGDRVQREQHELSTGQVTGPKLLQRHDPDLSEAEAVEKYEANVAYNRAHAAAAVEDALVGAAPTPEAREMAAAALKAAGAGGGSPAAPPAGGGSGGVPAPGEGPVPTSGMGAPQGRSGGLTGSN